MSHLYEVEIKSLLGSKESANSLVDLLMKSDPSTKLIATEKQLNHYFNSVSDTKSLQKALNPYITKEKQAAFGKILTDGKKLSVRTRDANGKVIFVIKASVGDDTSSNGVKRIEFESVVPLSLEELDQLLIKSGLTYQAKWSRERQEYVSGDVHVCLDKNAGYGYLAEFEKVVTDEKSLDVAKKSLLSFMDKLGVEELPQDRLERMFAHYNANWQSYYGTDNIFTIK